MTPPTTPANITAHIPTEHFTVAATYPLPQSNRQAQAIAEHILLSGVPLAPQAITIFAGRHSYRIKRDGSRLRLAAVHATTSIRAQEITVDDAPCATVWLTLHLMGLVLACDDRPC